MKKGGLIELLLLEIILSRTAQNDDRKVEQVARPRQRLSAGK